MKVHTYNTNNVESRQKTYKLKTREARKWDSNLKHNAQSTIYEKFIHHLFAEHYKYKDGPETQYIHTLKKRETPQATKSFATKPKDLSLILGTHIMEQKDQLLQGVPWH